MKRPHLNETTIDTLSLINIYIETNQKLTLGSYCPDNPVKAQHTRPSLQSHISLGSYLFVYSDI